MVKKGFKWTEIKYDKSFKLYKDNYKFVNYFSSENQLKSVNHKSDPELILKAFNRLVWVYASNHVREGVEIEDLVAEGQKGICKAIQEYNDADRQKPNYNFHQACLYNIRSNIFQYCLRNTTLIKTPYYIQRGCLHFSQIYKLMCEQTTAEKLLKRPGPATEQEIIDFLYDEQERLPLKSMKFIKAQITKKKSKEEFEQILSGILNHELGSRHSYVKNNLTDVGKVLHLKQKLYFTSQSTSKSYKRMIDLILSVKQTKVDLTSLSGSSNPANVEDSVIKNQLITRGKELCGEFNFNVFLQNKLFNKNYQELAEEFNLEKSELVSIIKQCLKLLQDDLLFKELYQEM